jgi:hypothetical protein
VNKTMTQKPVVHQGDLIAKPGVVYDCEEITGWLDASGADTKASFPKLTTVGGSLDASGDIGSKPKTNCQHAAAYCRKQLFAAFMAHGLYFADGILAKLISRKGRVARVQLRGRSETSYVVDDGQGNYSHGKTLKEARDGLLYKLSSRDTSEYAEWTPKTVVTLGDAIKAYRAITGACEGGVRGFCEQQGELPKKLTIAEVVKRTKGAYGNDAFAKFFSSKEA